MSMDRVESSRGSYEDKAENTVNVTAAVETINQGYEDKPEHTLNGKASVEIMKASMRSINMGGQLVPGIIDDITLNIISPRLSLADFHLLSSVSADWAEAIQSELVYKARVRTKSRETFVVFHHLKCLGHSVGLGWTQPRSPPGSRMVLSLYSMRDGSWHELPPAPGLDRNLFQCVSLDGKLYILGGCIEGGYVRGEWGTKEVYALDPLGAREWKLCASMLEARYSFNAVVRDGKIYVFGGTHPAKPNCGCEVYDPKVNTWSSIKPKPKPMPFSFNRSQVAAVGHEFILYGRNCDGVQGSAAEVYHPVEDKWRLMDLFGSSRPAARIFSAKGRFYSMMRMNPPSISVLDADKHLWTHLQSCKFPDISPNVYIEPSRIFAVDDELIARVYSDKRPISRGVVRCRDDGFLRSRGFGQEHTEIVWESIRPPHDCRGCLNFSAYILCCIQV